VRLAAGLLDTASAGSITLAATSATRASPIAKSPRLQNHRGCKFSAGGAADAGAACAGDAARE